MVEGHHTLCNIVISVFTYLKKRMNNKVSDTVC